MYHKNKMFIIPEMKAADIILDNPYILMLIEHLGIKLEVHEKTVDQLCNENKISTVLFLAIANLFNGFDPSPITKYSSSDIRNIITYLKNSHQFYLKEKYPQIQSYIEQIYKVNNHAEILLIEKFFEKYFEEVTEHLDYENEVVFPYVLNLDNQLKKKKYDDSVNNYSVTEYMEHHNDIEEKLADLKNLLVKYLPQKGDQQIRRKLVFCLCELEYDLKIHSQVEETILIPLVEKMEKLAGKIL